jgi:hypothetical protein
MSAAELVDNGSARIVAHARRSDQVRVASFLHHFGCAGGKHHFHCFILRSFDELVVIVMEIEGDVRRANAELIALL